MEDMGVTEIRTNGLLEDLLLGLGMMRFYTVGEKEVHVWEVPCGADAVTAAGKIHTDLARGFIKAEIVPFEDLMTAHNLTEDTPVAGIGGVTFWQSNSDGGGLISVDGTPYASPNMIIRPMQPSLIERTNRSA